MIRTALFFILILGSTATFVSQSQAQSPDRDGRTTQVGDASNQWRPRQPEAYQEGDELPEGATLVERRRTGLIVSGALTFGLPYLAGVLATLSLYDDDLADLAIPLAGPWLFMRAAGGDVVLIPPLVLDGFAQLTGVVLLIVGLVKKRKVIEWASDDQRRAWRVTPAVGTTTGLAFRLDFAGF